MQIISFNDRSQRVRFAVRFAGFTPVKLLVVIAIQMDSTGNQDKIVTTPNAAAGFSARDAYSS